MFSGVAETKCVQSKVIIFHHYNTDEGSESFLVSFNVLQTLRYYTHSDLGRRDSSPYSLTLEHLQMHLIRVYVRSSHHSRINSFRVQDTNIIHTLSLYSGGAATLALSTSISLSEISLPFEFGLLPASLKFAPRHSPSKHTPGCSSVRQRQAMHNVIDPSKIMKLIWLFDRGRWKPPDSSAMRKTEPLRCESCCVKFNKGGAEERGFGKAAGGRRWPLRIEDGESGRFVPSMRELWGCRGVREKVQMQKANSRE